MTIWHNYHSGNDSIHWIIVLWTILLMRRTVYRRWRITKFKPFPRVRMGMVVRKRRYDRQQLSWYQNIHIIWVRIFVIIAVFDGERPYARRGGDVVRSWSVHSIMTLSMCMVDMVSVIYGNHTFWTARSCISIPICIISRNGHICTANITLPYIIHHHRQMHRVPIAIPTSTTITTLIITIILPFWMKRKWVYITYTLDIYHFTSMTWMVHQKKCSSWNEMLHWPTIFKRSWIWPPLPKGTQYV